MNEPEVTPEVEAAIAETHDLLERKRHMLTGERDDWTRQLCLLLTVMTLKGEHGGRPLFDLSAVDSNKLLITGDASKLHVLVDLAELGDVDADQVLRLIIDDALAAGRPVPEVFTPYARRLVSKGAMAPRWTHARVKQGKHVSRDLLIVFAVQRLVDGGRFNATSNREPKVPKASACYVVAQALDRLGHDIDLLTVEKAWQKRPNGKGRSTLTVRKPAGQ